MGELDLKHTCGPSQQCVLGAVRSDLVIEETLIESTKSTEGLIHGSRMNEDQIIMDNVYADIEQRQARMQQYIIHKQ